MDPPARPSRARPEGAVLASDAVRIERLVVPTPFRVGPVNCYLIDAGRLTLVDTGPNTEGALEALTGELARVGRRPEEIEVLLLTHQHFDHVGLAPAIVRRSGAEVITSRHLAGFLADYQASMAAEDEFAGAVMVSHGIDPEDVTTLVAGSWERRTLGGSVKVDRVVADGELVDLGGLELRVALRPGHSPTDTIFVDERGERAIVGDHLIAHISSNPILHRPLEGPVDPLDPPQRLVEYLASMRKTSELGLEHALPGHGEAVGDVSALVERRIAGHERRKERIAAEIGDGADTVRGLIDALWPGLDVDQVYLATSEVLGHIDLLRAEQRVTRIVDGATIRFELLR